MPAERGGGMFSPGGPVAREILELGWLMTGLGLVAFAVFAVALAVALVRRHNTDEGKDGPSPQALRRLVVGAGALFPAVVLIIVLVFTVDTMHAIPDEGENALVVEVVGNQWWWAVSYPDHDVVTANEIHLPVGRDVEVHLTSRDVIHSFWVPQLAGKVDALPDGVNTLVLRTDQPGIYRTQCAEFCGLQHARMGLHVVVEPEADFEAWLDANSAPAADPAGRFARRGSELFGSAGCASCHAVRGTRFDGDVGPDLTHLMARRAIGAATLPLTSRNLRRWIEDPHDIKAGVDMPRFALDDEELAALIAYLEELE